MRGYWRTLRVRTACRPAMMMSRLTTIASTGRRRKTSVSFMSAVLGVRFQARVRPDGVVDDDRGVVAQLEGARRHDLLPGRDPLGHRHEVTAHLTEAHELL